MTWGQSISSQSPSLEEHCSSEPQPTGAGPRGQRSQRRSRRSKRQELKDSCNALRTRCNTPKPRRKQDALSWMLRNVALLMTLCLIPWASGCCSGVNPLPPERVEVTLPAGRPTAAETAALARELSALSPDLGTDSVRVPLPVIRRLNGQLDKWRAYAVALETLIGERNE